MILVLVLIASILLAWIGLTTTFCKCNCDANGTMTVECHVLSTWKQLKKKQMIPIFARLATGLLRLLGSFHAICSDRHPISSDRVFALEAARLRISRLRSLTLAIRRHERQADRGAGSPNITEWRLDAPRSEAKQAARAAFCPRFLEGRVNQKGSSPGRKTVRSAGDRGSVGRVFLGTPDCDAALDSGFGPHGFTPSELRCST